MRPRYFGRAVNGFYREAARGRRGANSALKLRGMASSHIEKRKAYFNRHHRLCLLK